MKILEIKLLYTLLLFLSASLIGGKLFGQSQLEIAVEYPRKKLKSPAKIVVTSNGMRIDAGPKNSNDPYSIIVNNMKNLIWVLNLEDNTYLEFKKDSPIAKFNKEKEKIATQWETMYEKLAPDKRAEFKKMMPGFKPKPKEVLKEGAKAKIAGYSCKIYKKYLDNKLSKEYCYSDDKAFLGTLKNIKRVQNVWKEIYPGQENYYINSEKGFPISVKSYDDFQKLIKIETLTKFTPKINFKKSPIAIPSGFSKK